MINPPYGFDNIEAGNDRDSAQQTARHVSLLLEQYLRRKEAKEKEVESHAMATKGRGNEWSSIEERKESYDSTIEGRADEWSDIKDPEQREGILDRIARRYTGQELTRKQKILLKIQRAKEGKEARHDINIRVATADDDREESGIRSRRPSLDQFAADKQLLDSKSRYDEQSYATAVDRANPQYAERDARAEKSTPEAEKSAASRKQVSPTSFIRADESAGGTRDTTLEDIGLPERPAGHDPETGDYDVPSGLHVEPTFSKETASEFHKDPADSVSRPLTNTEAWAMYEFEMHARDCVHCDDPYNVHRQYEQLCDQGHRLAQEVARYLYQDKDGEIYSYQEVVGDDTGSSERICVEILPEYDEVRGLLKAVEQSIRWGGEPFVSMERKFDVAPHSQGPSEPAKVEHPTEK